MSGPHERAERLRYGWRARVDGLLCLAMPSLARWTVVYVVPIVPMSSVRMRWRSSAEKWCDTVADWVEAECGVRPPLKVSPLMRRAR